MDLYVEQIRTALDTHVPYRRLLRQRCELCGLAWPCGAAVWAADEWSRIVHPGGPAAERLTGWGATRAAGTCRNNGQTRSLTPGSTVRP